MKLREDIDLYKGIFWFRDLDNLTDELFITIYCDSDGNALDNYNFNAKTGTTFNHKKTWKELPKNLTNNKPFNYYPRGRVEISNGRAKIYLNGNLNKVIIDKFNLTERNRIKEIKVIEDNSYHYLCYLDRERRN